jgi:SAM-dependent methyltransferase
MVILLFVVLFLFLLLTALTMLGWFNIVLPLAIFVICATIIFIFLWLYEVYRVLIKGYAPYVRSSKKLIERILQEIDFKDNATVYDLGCGDGRFLRQLAKRKKVKAVGYEYFSVPYLLAQVYNFFSKNKVKFYYRDFFKANLADADYVFCYLITREMAPLEEKLKKELKPGALVIANTFQFKNWQAEKSIILDEAKRTALSNKLYFYRQK